jgi:hypothetical protein
MYEQGLLVDETKARWFGCSIGKLTMEQQGGWLEHMQFTSTNGKFSNCTN